MPFSLVHREFETVATKSLINAVLGKSVEFKYYFAANQINVAMNIIRNNLRVLKVSVTIESSTD